MGTCTLSKHKHANTILKQRCICKLFHGLPFSTNLIVPRGTRLAVRLPYKWDDEMDAMVMWAAANQTVHAYHAIRGEARLGSGANLNIFQLENEPHMSDMVNSDITVTGFSGKDVMEREAGKPRAKEL